MTPGRDDKGLAGTADLFYEAWMRQRVRKLVGTIVLFVFVTIYALVVMTIAAAKLPGTSGWVQLVFYMITGLLWVIPAGALIFWMGRQDKTAT